LDGSDAASERDVIGGVVRAKAAEDDIDPRLAITMVVKCGEEHCVSVAVVEDEALDECELASACLARFQLHAAFGVKREGLRHALSMAGATHIRQRGSAVIPVIRQGRVGLFR